MRTYHKRAPEWAYCAHCDTAFERAHQRRIYCCNSCCTQAYNVRQAAQAAAAPPAGPPPPPGPPPEVTLAVNWQNAAVLAGSVLVADGLQHLAKQLLAPADAPVPLAGPPVLSTGPTSWLPPALRRLPVAPVPLQLPGWAAPGLFQPLPYANEVYYYCAPDDVLLWQDAAGSWHQLTHEEQFLHVVYHRPGPPVTALAPTAPPPDAAARVPGDSSASPSQAELAQAMQAIQAVLALSGESSPRRSRYQKKARRESPKAPPPSS